MDFFKSGDGVKKSRGITRACQVFSFLLTMLLLFSAQDFITTVVSDSDSYEIKYETEETLDNGQMLYRLYKDDQYIEDVDPNRYYLLDSEGNTDFRYCALTEDAGSLAYAAILGAMLMLIVSIIESTQRGTPFTKANVRRIRAISLLQLALAIVPGAVKLIMTLVRFDYISSTFSLNSFYMLIIAFVIAMIAQAFDYGVKLQEDSDSIA